MVGERVNVLCGFSGADLFQGPAAWYNSVVLKVRRRIGMAEV